MVLQFKEGFSCNRASRYSLALGLIASVLAVRGPCQTAANVTDRPEAVLQVGHRRAVRALVFSPDGTWLASGAKDNTIKIWDVATGRLLRTIYGHGSPVNALAVSPDSKRLASGSGTVYDPRYAAFYLKGGLTEGQHEDTSVREWDVRTGRQLRILSGHVLAVTALAYSQDGISLTSVSSDTIRVWHLNSDSPVKTVQVIAAPKLTYDFTGVISDLPHDDPYEKMWKSYFKDSTIDTVISPAGDLVAVAIPEKKFRLFSVAQNREIKTLDIEAQPDFHKPLAFSPDGQNLAYIQNRTELIFATISTNRRLWHVSVRDPATAICFFPAGNTLLIETTGNKTRTLHYLSAADGNEIGQATILDDRPSSLVIVSPDARLIALVAKGEHFIELRAAPTGYVARVLKTPGQPSKGWLEENFNGRDPALSSALLAAGISQQGEIREAEEDISDFSSTYRSGSSILFTPDNRWLLWKGGSSGVHVAALWDTINGMQVPDTQNARFREIGNPDHSPDGRFRVEPQYETQTHANYLEGLGLPRTRGENKLSQRLKLLDAHNGRKLHTLEVGDALEVGVIPTSGFNPDGSRIAVRGFKSSKGWLATEIHWDIYIFDTISGRKVNQFETPDFDEESGLPTNSKLKGHGDYNKIYRTIAVPNALAVSPNGAIVAVGYSSKISLFEVATGQLRQNISHPGGVAALTFSPNGNFLAALSKDGDTYVFDAHTGRMEAILVCFSATSDELGSNEWLVVTPDGRFDGSPIGWGQILWRFNGDTFNAAPVETFFNEFYYPGLLAEVLAGKNLGTVRDFAQLDRRQASVKMGISDVVQPVTSRTYKVQLQVEEALPDSKHSEGSGVRDVRLFRNGSLVKWWHGDLQLDDTGKAVLDVVIPIIAGENRLTAYAFNRDNIKSADASFLVTGSSSLKKTGTAYVVSVGINEYSNHDYSLNFAVPDARDMADQLSIQQKKLGTVANVVSITLFDSQATKQNLLFALQRLGDSNNEPPSEGVPAIITQLQPAQPEDEVFIFFAGHGIALGPRFYLIPHDMGYMGKRDQMTTEALQTILGRSISDLELEQVIEKIDARNLVLVIDACNSGQVLESEEKRRGPMNSKGLAQVAYEKGIFVLSAAQGYQAALEKTELGHGLLTYALVEEGLKTAAADRDPKDGKVAAKEWLDYATVRVPELQSSTQTQGDRVGRSVSFVEDAGSTKESGLQRPRVFYRREIDPEPLIIAVPRQ